MIKEKELNKVLDNLTESLISLKSERLEALNDLKESQINIQSLRQMEAERLNKKLGENHPRARQLASRLEHNLNIINDLEVKLEIAKIKVSPVDKNETLIHGRVIDEKYRGAEGFVVHMENKKGETIEKVETDPSGYYSFVIDKEKAEEISKTMGTGIFINVYTNGGQLIQKSDPLKIASGDRLAVDMMPKKKLSSVFRDISNDPIP